MKKLSQGLALLLACILLFQCGISSVYAEDILPDGSDAGSANISVDADKDDQQPEDEQQGDTPDEDDQKPEDEQQGDTPDEDDQKPEDEQQGDTPDKDDQQPEDEQQGDTPDESDQQPEDEQQGDTPDEDDQKPEDEQKSDTPDEDDQQPEDELSAVPMLLGAAPPAQSNGGIGQWGTSSQADGDGVHLIVGWYEPDGDKSSRPESVEVTVYWKTPDHVIHTGTVTLGKGRNDTDVDTMERDLGVYEAKDYEGKIDRWKTWPNYTPEGSTTPQGKDHQKGVTYDFPDIPGYNVKIIDGDCGVIYIKADQTDKTGSIIIDKETVGGETPENAVFVVTDFNTGEVKATIKYSDFTQVGNDKNHRQYTLIGLPLGTYKIRELGAEQDGYVLTVQGSKAGHNDPNFMDVPDNDGKFEWNSGPEASANNNNSDRKDIAYIRNTYEKSDTFIELQATKSYENGTLTDEQFTFKLMEGPVQVSTATNDADGSIKFPKIYYKEAGTYTYTISEVAGDSSDGIIYDSKSYNVTVTVTGEGEKLTATADQDYLENGITFTNTYNRTTVSGSKTWDDNNNQDGIRPTSITIRLYADGVEKKSQTVSAANGWKWSFTDLPMYKVSEDGEKRKINYSISEDLVNNYTSAVNGYDVTNKHTPATTSVTVNKTWEDNDNQDGIRPTSITINLLANEKKIDSKVVTADDNWSWTFDDLPKYADGKEIKYTITENAVDGYTATYYGTNVTNTHTPETTSVTVNKTWNDNDDQDGKRPESITIRLYADGEQVDSKEVKATDNWSWTFANLPKYADGKEITYSIREDQVNNYTSAVNGYDVTNTHTPEKTSVSGSKTWDDNDDQDGIRPESIMIRLYAGDQLVRSQTVTADDDGKWTWSFTDLPKYANGEEIKYTITEDEVTGYEAKIDGYDVTNKHTPETTTVNGSKTWNDNNDQDGMRPESITIRLYADGVEVDSKEVKATDNWSWTFDDLDKYADGKEITYTITEDPVEDYTAEIDGYDVTNTYDPVMPFSHDGNGGRKTGVTPEPSKTPETSAASHAGVETPTTGDTSALGAWSFSAAMALALLAVVVWRKRANDRRRDEMQ